MSGQRSTGERLRISNFVQMPAQVYCLLTSLWINSVIFLFIKMKTLKNYFAEFDVGTAPSMSPNTELCLQLGPVVCGGFRPRSLKI